MSAIRTNRCGYAVASGEAVPISAVLCGPAGDARSMASVDRAPLPLRTGRFTAAASLSVGFSNLCSGPEGHYLNPGRCGSWTDTRNAFAPERPRVHDIDRGTLHLPSHRADGMSTNGRSAFPLSVATLKK